MPRPSPPPVMTACSLERISASLYPYERDRIERHQFHIVSPGRTHHRRRTRSRNLLRRGADIVRRQERRLRLDIRNGARRARACDRGRAWRLGNHPCQRRTLHRAQIRRRDLPRLAWLQDVSRGARCARAAARHCRQPTGISRGRAGRSAKSEDRGILSGLHSAIPRPGQRLCRAPVHHARPGLGDAQYAGRCGRSDDSRDSGGKPRAPAASAAAPEAGLGAVHRRPRCFGWRWPGGQLS